MTKIFSYFLPLHPQGTTMLSAERRTYLNVYIRRSWSQWTWSCHVSSVSQPSVAGNQPGPGDKQRQCEKVWWGGDKPCPAQAPCWDLLLSQPQGQAHSFSECWGSYRRPSMDTDTFPMWKPRGCHQVPPGLRRTAQWRGEATGAGLTMLLPFSVPSSFSGRCPWRSPWLLRVTESHSSFPALG